MAGEDVDFGSAHITIDLNDGSTDAQARQTGAQIQRALLNATRRIGDQIRRQIQRGLNAQAVTVRVEPDLRWFDAQLLNGLRSVDSLNIPVAPDVTGFVERLRALLADVEIPIRVVPDLDELDRRIRAHNAPDVRVNANVNVDNDRLTRSLAGLGSAALRVGKVLGTGLKFGAYGIAAAGAASGVAKLTAALAPAAGAIAAGPAAIAGFQTALGTLKLAVLGVDDALSAALSGDADAFSKAIEDLAPAAQKAVTAIRNLQPQLKKVQQSVQQSFFKQFSGDVTAAVRNLLPLGSGLDKIAAGFGRATDQGLKFATSKTAFNGLQGIVKGTSDAVGGLSTAVQPLARGLLSVASSVATAFGAQVGQAIGDVGTRIGNFLTRLGDSGRAVSLVRGALTVFQQLGAIAQNVGSILANVWRAANVNGGGLLNNLKQITGAFAQFAQTAAGQTAIGNVFKTVAQIAAQLGPILSALVTQLGAIAPALGPVFVALGPAITGLINALGPALAAIAPVLQEVANGLAAAFAVIGPALGPVGAAVGQVLSALTPLLPLVGQVVSVLAGALAPVLQLLTGLFEPIIQELVAALMPVLPPLAQAFAVLVQALTPLATGIGQAIGQLLAALAPLFTTLAGALGQVAASLAPVITALVNALMPTLPGLVSAFSAMVQAVLPLLPSLAGLVASVAPLAVLLLRIVGPIAQIGAAFDTWLAINLVVPIIQGVVSVLTGLISGITSVITFIAQLPGMIVSGLSALGSMLASFFTGLFTSIGQFVVSGFQTVVGFFAQLPGMILAGLQALPGLLLNLFTSAVAGIAIALLTLLAGIVFTFTELPGRIASALASLGTFLLNAFVSGFNAATSAISSFLSSAASFFSQLPGRIGSALAALPGRVSSLFRSAGSSALSAASSAGSAVVSFFSGLPGRIGSALSSVGSRIAGAFRSAASSAKNAVSSLISGVVSLFSGLGSRIVGAIGNVGGQIMSKIKSGLPSSVRKYLPFASGGIVYGPTHALIGEAGPEVVIPLTRPKRAAELAARSGLLDMLGVGQARTLAATTATAASAGGSAASSVLSSLSAALSGIASLLNTVGAQVVQGMVDGIRQNQGLVAAAAQDMAGTAVTAAETTLQIASPSKVFAKIGQLVGAGFVKGLTGTAAQIKSTTDAMVKAITDAFKGKKTRVDDQLVAMLSSGNTKLQKLATQRDALVKRITDARKFAADTTNTALQAFSLQSLTQGADKVTASTLTAGLQSAVNQVKTFTAEVNRLAKRGLSKSLLQQVIGLGPEQGASIAAALSSATSDQLKRLNNLQGQLSKASTTLGNTGADLLYDSGAQAAKGFLAGLKGQQKAIEKLMLDIAKGMQTAIKAALHIKSPSRVFMHIGDMTGLGLHIGFLRRLAGLQDASRVAARNLADGVTAQLTGLGGRGGDGVVIPLTRMQRARQAAADGTAAATARGARAAGGGLQMTNYWTINEVGDAHMTAHRVLNRLVLAAGVS
ncbi:hypothetical protein HEP81_04689 [Streptomyces griseofuscus]|uniref:Phage-related protein n=1 Tax=Streptomyces griseofuscus TaxID=146922 RepID=A0A7H1Q3T1_9ACTN|nr:hypothetical protein [Streptomyces griseofuscus]QNT94961.1 hypothetical protein HEP81_04689 [Streptomyces griseofuscus]